jgi:putative endonuclease
MELRLSQHQQGKFPDAYTFRRRPVALVWHSHFERIDEAIATERRI